MQTHRNLKPLPEWIGQQKRHVFSLPLMHPKKEAQRNMWLKAEDPDKSWLDKNDAQNKAKGRFPMAFLYDLKAKHPLKIP